MTDFLYCFGCLLSIFFIAWLVARMYYRVDGQVTREYYDKKFINDLYEVEIEKQRILNENKRLVLELQKKQDLINALESRLLREQERKN